MNKKEVDILVKQGVYPCKCQTPELIETHISWVILCDQNVFKIKKPIHYTFLDFSTLEKRKYYCEKEITLNKRLTKNIYSGIIPITQNNGMLTLGKTESDGNIIDYAVQMKKLNPEKRMDKVLRAGRVSANDIYAIADKLIPFHQKATIIYHTAYPSIKEEFNDIEGLTKQKKPTEMDASVTITNAIEMSNHFLEKNADLLAQRQEEKFVRDCHGDLHSRNIFLLDHPVIFDCIEFNNNFRQIDILNELAFFCMDLEAFGYHDLSDQFFNYYNSHFEVCRNEAELHLFVYYKAYRANVRAKVNLLRAQSAIGIAVKKQALQGAEKYLRLMKSYLDILSIDSDLNQNSEHNKLND
jgi:aminoglycoside phosphotransferase family enzyme